MSNITFRHDTLDQLRDAAVGMGMLRADVLRMSRATLEAEIQLLHAAECRAEARQEQERQRRRAA